MDFVTSNFVKSSSVVVKADKKLLTVALNDGRDGRAFTLKVLHLSYIYAFPSVNSISLMDL